MKRIIAKIRRDGFKGAAKAVGQVVHAKLFSADWDFELVPALLERILKEKGGLTLVQVGANVGDTENDQVYKFVKAHSSGAKIRAIAIEPVRNLYQQLAANYADVPGVSCLNVAIAENSGIKPFYRLREGIDLAAHGLPPFSHQLGSFLRENLASLWQHDPGNQALKDFVNANTIEEPVRCLTLAEALTQENVTDVDLLMIDTEGYDYQVLRTLDFKRSAPRYINYERIHLGKDEGACRRLLIAHGYGLHDHGQDTLCTLNQNISVFQRWAQQAYSHWLEAIF